MNYVEVFLRNIPLIGVTAILVYAGIQGIMMVSPHRHPAQARTAPVSDILDKIAAKNVGFAGHARTDSSKAGNTHVPRQ